MPDAIVYTETVVHSAPERYIEDVPYQLAIVDLPAGGRQTVRILGPTHAKIGDTVTFVEEKKGVPYYTSQR